MEHVTTRMQRGLKCSERPENCREFYSPAKIEKHYSQHCYQIPLWPSDNKHTYIHKSPIQDCTLLETDLWCCSWNLLDLQIYGMYRYSIYIYTYIHGRDWKCPLMVTPPTTRKESTVGSSYMLPAAGSAPWRAPQHTHTPDTDLNSSRQSHQVCVVLVLYMVKCF